MEHTKTVRTKKKRVQVISFDILISNRNYMVNATPFNGATGEQFYRVGYNNGPVHIFGWDEGLERYAETDTLADVIPPIIEMAIAGKLNEYAHEMQHAA